MKLYALLALVLAPQLILIPPSPAYAQESSSDAKMELSERCVLHEDDGAARLACGELELTFRDTEACSVTQNGQKRILECSGDAHLRQTFSKTEEAVKEESSSGQKRMHLTEEGLDALEPLDSPLTVAKIEALFPEHDIEKTQGIVGEGIKETFFFVRSNGKKEFTITPTKIDGEAVGSLTVFASYTEGPLGVRPGERFGKVLEQVGKTRCWMHAEGTAGDVICIREDRESRVSYTVGENENDVQVNCPHPRYSCSYEPESLADNEIESLNWH